MRTTTCGISAQKHTWSLGSPGLVLFVFNLYRSKFVSLYCEHQTRLAVGWFATSKAAHESKTGKGKLGESQGRKASGLHDYGHLPAGLPSISRLIFRSGVALYLMCQTKGGGMAKLSNRNLPVEQWPESLEILRLLAAQAEPKPIKEVALGVHAPEISTRNRLAKLESVGTVRAMRCKRVVAQGKPVKCTHYVITQYGRDCVCTRLQAPKSAVRLGVNSVFALGAALE